MSLCCNFGSQKVYSFSVFATKIGLQFMWLQYRNYIQDVDFVAVMISSNYVI